MESPPVATTSVGPAESIRCQEAFVRTANYAVMFTDIKGYTERTSRQTRAENARMLVLHDALLLPVIQGYGGRRVKTIGDAYLVVFDSVTKALAAGAALQDRLALYNSFVSDRERIDVRVALNAGEVRLAEDDVYGEAVNIASRVEEMADAGEVCFTEAVYLLADRSWLEFEELGPHTLRGIPEPVKLFRLRRSRQVSLPYGGAALKSLQLPDPTPQQLARYRGNRLRRWGKWALAACVAAALAAALLFGWQAWNSALPRVERLASSGKLQEAREALQKEGVERLGAARYAYLEGVIAQSRGAPGEAIERFRRAALRDRHLGEDRVASRLEAMLEHESCEMRTRAAEVLGELKLPSSVDDLQRLSAREPPPTGFFEGIGIGGCNAGDAARKALTRIAEGS